MLRQAARTPETTLTVILVAIALLGVGIRLYQLGATPYGLYQDEAVNGLDALSVLEGDRPLYFTDNNGREPLYGYLMTLTVGVFGPTVLGVRAISALLGILTIPVGYLLGCSILNSRRAGLLTMAMLAISLWHVHLSRVGFRAISLILFSGLFVACATVAVRRQSRLAAIGSGMLLGLCAYTYLPARLLPLILLIFFVYLFVWHRHLMVQNRELLTYGFSAALLVSLPMIILLLTQPDVVLGRSGQVAIWNEVVHKGHPLQTALKSLLATLGMFNWLGDDIWRHNVPGRPVFDLFTGLAFLFGLGLSIRQVRQRPELAFVLLWVTVMLVPTVLAEDAPHFLRASGVLPLLYLLPAYALNWLVDRYPGWASSIGVSGLLLLSMGLTARDYFGCRTEALVVNGSFTGCYATEAVRGYFFQAEATQLAEAVLDAEGSVLLADRFWNTFPSVRYLLADADHVALYSETEGLPSELTLPVTMVAWPFSDLARVQAALPPDTGVEIINGPQTRGDLEPETYQLYVMYKATLLHSPGTETVTFANGIALEGVDIIGDEHTLSVHLQWATEQEIDQPVQVFAQYVTPDRQVLAQQDDALGTQFYPALSWQVGHVIIQTVNIQLVERSPEGQVLVGLYNPESGERITIQNANLPTENNALILEPEFNIEVPR